ncbi:hypothetical protein [Mammaliicoccus sciuri]|uniref:hypothetical protein n=1 Tax=Mammaliicoccus sciuri TaxID=1296 RepID=UPI002DBF8201|nr:hypothetical protein [Mammaliicoccus sciuri]MEB7819609.1 hypothetical protein [Mammaliicoccus sciuri]
MEKGTKTERYRAVGGKIGQYRTKTVRYRALGVKIGGKRTKTERYRAVGTKIGSYRTKTTRYRAVGAKIGPYRTKTERYRAPLNHQYRQKPRRSPSRLFNNTGHYNFNIMNIMSFRKIQHE